MQNGNLYGLLITVLSLAIALILTMRQIEGRLIRIELVIQPMHDTALPRRTFDAQRREGSRQGQETKVAAKSDRLMR